MGDKFVSSTLSRELDELTVLSTTSYAVSSTLSTDVQLRWAVTSLTASLLRDGFDDLTRAAEQTSYARACQISLTEFL